MGDVQKGRGAYVCATTTCLEGIDAKRLSKAFRKQVILPSTNQKDGRQQSLLSWTHDIAAQRILETIGLSRRAGQLKVGSDRALSSQEGGVLLGARDLAPRTLRAVDKAGGVAFLDQGVLSKASGMNSVSVLRIPKGRFAKRATYWMKIWKATRTSQEHRPEKQVSQTSA
jgi:hypothetical protein